MHTRLISKARRLPLFTRGGSACCGARALLVLSFMLFSSACVGHMRVGKGRAIPWDASVQPLVPTRHGSAHVPEPLAAPYAPEHPFMAPHGASSMHVDPFTTNAYSWAGPLGHAPEVSSRSMGFLGGECPTINFDRKGRIVTVCVSKKTPTLLLLEPESLSVLASYELPARRTSMLMLRKTMNDTSGGAYFYLDHLDRAVVGTADGAIEIIAVEGEGELVRFVKEERIELAEQLRLPDGQLDKITAVMPDFSGNYWFVARYGTMGFVEARAEGDRRPRRVVSRRLWGEEIENSFSMAPEGAYIVSDHALYHFAASERGELELVWREAYDRGTRRKVGQINQGSGTTPTLLGEDYVVIADNAEPRMNVLVYRRKAEARDRLVCQTPVFSDGQSATENTLI